MLVCLAMTSELLPALNMSILYSPIGDLPPAAAEKLIGYGKFRYYNALTTSDIFRLSTSEVLSTDCDCCRSRGVKGLRATADAI